MNGANHLTWKWYRYGPNKKYECWEVVNLITKHKVLTSTEEASLKIIELAYALKMGLPKPLNFRPLEYKAKDLEGIPLSAQRYWNWDGKELSYDTIDYE